MSEKLFVFTASSSEAYKHYIETIEEGVSLSHIQEFIPKKDLFELEKLYKDKKVKAWGALPGPSNKANWEKLEKGDKILIYRQKNYEYYATIVYKIHNPDLARKLWQTTTTGETWEYAYLLADVTEISLPVEEFNKLVGYQAANYPQGFQKMGEGKTLLITDRFHSIDSFLKFLRKGEWVRESSQFTEPIKRQILQEKSYIKPFSPPMEANLEEFVVRNISLLEEGLVVVGRQLSVQEMGRLDLLCSDKENNLVVVELKKDKATSSIIDQTQRYMGWIIDHRAERNQKVRGIIVVREKDTALTYAVKANPNLSVKEFKLSFT